MQLEFVYEISRHSISGYLRPGQAVVLHYYFPSLMYWSYIMNVETHVVNTYSSIGGTTASRNHFNSILVRSPVGEIYALIY